MGLLVEALRTRGRWQRRTCRRGGDGASVRSSPTRRGPRAAARKRVAAAKRPPAGSSTCEASAKAAPLELLMTARIHNQSAPPWRLPQALRTLHATLHETTHETWPCCSSGASFCMSLAATVSSTGFLRWPAQQIGERWMGGSWCAGRVCTRAAMAASGAAAGLRGAGGLTV